jgi:hypothetical protein
MAPVERGQVRDLDLLQVVDSHGIGMPFASQEDLDKVCDDAQLLEFAISVLRPHPQCPVRCARPFTVRDEVGSPDSFGHRRKEKVVEPPAHIAAGIAVL